MLIPFEIISQKQKIQMKFVIAILLFTAVAVCAETGSIVYGIAGGSELQSNLLLLYNTFEKILPAIYTISKAFQSFLQSLGLGAFTEPLNSFTNSLAALIGNVGANDPGTLSMGFQKLTGNITISKN